MFIYMLMYNTNENTSNWVSGLHIYVSPPAQKATSTNFQSVHQGATYLFTPANGSHSLSMVTLAVSSL